LPSSDVNFEVTALRRVSSGMLLLIPLRRGCLSAMEILRLHSLVFILTALEKSNGDSFNLAGLHMRVISGMSSIFIVDSPPRRSATEAPARLSRLLNKRCATVSSTIILICVLISKIQTTTTTSSSATISTTAVSESRWSGSRRAPCVATTLKDLLRLICKEVSHPLGTQFDNLLRLDREISFATEATRTSITFRV
jgi:hypothetical protein